MKKQSLLIILLFLFSFGFTQTANLQIKISGIKADSGVLRIGLFNNAEGYKSKSNPIFENSFGVADSVTETVFQQLPTDVYAIAIYHDANNDNELNKRKLGIPNEGVGFSGVRQSGFKPPEFPEASFRLTKDTILDIQLRYPKSK